MIPFGFGEIYLAGALISNGLFFLFALRLYTSPSKQMARQVFFYSLWYLVIIFGAMVADRLILA